MGKLLVLDCDTILYSSAAMHQENKCNVIHKSSGREKLFDSKTSFNDWIKSQDKWTKDEFDFQVVSSIVGETRFAFQSIKQKIENILEATKCTDYKICIEGEGNFRKDFESKYVQYKSHRPPKPLLFEECREFVVKKYKKQLVESVQRETDDSCNIYAWESYEKALKSKNKDGANVILAACDKDLFANSRGWMFNYFKPEKGVFWNDAFQQSYNFATQLLTGDNADAIPGIEKLSDITRERFSIKTKGVGPATATKILAECKTERDLAQRVYECYSAAWEEDWDDRLNENGFFLYLLRSEKDKWNMDRYLE
jgi:predicted metal-binding protein